MAGSFKNICLSASPLPCRYCRLSVDSLAEAHKEAVVLSATSHPSPLLGRMDVLSPLNYLSHLLQASSKATGSVIH